MFACSTYDGPGISLRRVVRTPLQREQARARRNATWLFLHEVGMPDCYGRCRPESVADLALMFGVTRQTVLNGLAAAKHLRLLVTEAS